MPGPLDGIRIIDFTAMISGPLGSMILADQGAEVIKIENPNGGDHARGVATRRGGFSASFLNNNRNKRSVALDLRSDEGKSAALRLIEGADIVMQNFRPGVVERLGLDYSAAKVVKPDIIYASITGFGHEGPYSAKPVFDPLIQSLSGLTTVQATSDLERPRLIRTILPDKLTGFTVAQAISAALVHKLRTGEGQQIRLSMLDTVVAFLWSSDMGGYTFIGEEIDPVEAQSFIDLIYETRDGYISVAAFRRVDWEKLADACDKPEWKTDPRFLTTPGLEEYKTERLELTQSALMERTADEWIEILDAHDVPCAPVLTRSQMIDHPQIAANELIVESTHPDAGPLRQARPPALFEGTPLEHRSGAPRLGADTRAVLADAGFAPDEISRLIAREIASETKEAAE